MLRRNARLRREYLYRKGLEGKERIEYERKRKIREALAEGKAIPTELRREAEEIRKGTEYDDITKEYEPSSHIDDEYANANLREPNVLVTTSREPSTRLKQFAKELKILFPNSRRINRGNMILKHVVEHAKTEGVTDVIIAHETRGQPDGLIISHMPYGPTAYFRLTNTVLRHDIPDIGTMSEAYPHLIFENFSTPLGKRVQNVLKYLFPPPKPDSKRILTFRNDNDYVSFRHHTYKREGKEIDLQEVGPRFEMMLFQLKLGTMDQTEADNEWVLRPYFTTAHKRRAL